MLKSKSFKNYFTKANTLVCYLRDFGSATCLLNVLEELSATCKVVQIFFDNDKLKEMYQIKNSFYEEIYLLPKEFLPHDKLLICQSSFVSTHEKSLTSKVSWFYVIQDYAFDFKFDNCLYFTPFSYAGEDIKNHYTTIKGMKKNNILPTNLSFSDDLLIIGARDLLHKEYARGFISDISQMLKTCKIYYKPHPMEEPDFRFLESLDIYLVESLFHVNLFPKNLISPFSSLGYDIPFFAYQIKREKMNVYHGFGTQFDNWVRVNYPSWQPMLFENAVNYDSAHLGEFLKNVNG